LQPAIDDVLLKMQRCHESKRGGPSFIRRCGKSRGIKMNNKNPGLLAVAAHAELNVVLANIATPEAFP